MAKSVRERRLPSTATISPLRPARLAIWIGAGRPLGPDQRLAVCPRRPSALFPQRPGHPALPRSLGDDGGLRPELHGGIRQERDLPRLVDPPGTGRRRSSAGAAPSWRTSSTSWSRPALDPLAGGAGGLPLARPGRAIATAVALFLVYVWTDFPINYAAFGMLPYLLAIPLGLVATALLPLPGAGGARLVARSSAVLMSLVVLVHLTAAMIVAARGRLAYLTAIGVTAARLGGSAAYPHRLGIPPGEVERFPCGGMWGSGRHPDRVLAVNAFWWLPGALAGLDQGAERLRFRPSRRRSLARLWQILSVEAPIESVLCGLGLARAGRCWRQRDRVSGGGAGRVRGGRVFLGLPGGRLPRRSTSSSRAGRPTPSTRGSALAAGLGVAAVSDPAQEAGRVPARSLGGRRCVLIGFASSARRWSSIARGSGLARPVVGSRADRREPFLSSRPTPRLLWVVDRVKRHVKPGERLLYEEGGFGLPGVPDPFEGGRFSGLLPELTGVEVLGGPYLHASLTTNFTQFGEGKLFGKADWGRDHFVRYATALPARGDPLLEPARPGVLPGEPRPDRGPRRRRHRLDRPGAGFRGGCDRGNRPRSRRSRGGCGFAAPSAGVDGMVVLRYHSVPCLRTRSAGRLGAGVSGRGPGPVHPSATAPRPRRPWSWVSPRVGADGPEAR